jgi:uncharacterized membrane protein
MAEQGPTPAFGGLGDQGAQQGAQPVAAAPNAAPAAPANNKGAPAAAKDTAREIAYREVPPQLEDSAIEGPWRSSVPNALDHYEDREAIQADRSWFRYSGCAFPFLVSLFFMALVVFILTVAQGNMDFRGMRHGNPRALVEPQYSHENDHEYEGGNRIVIRDLRRVSYVIYFVGAFLFFVMPKSMKSIGALGGAVLLFCGAIFGFVTFMYAIHALDDVKDCWRLQWLPLNAGLRMTHSNYVQCPQNEWEWAFQMNVFMTFTDAALLMIALITAPLILIWSTAGKAWVKFSEPEKQAMRAEGHAPEREMRIRRALGWRDSNFNDPNRNINQQALAAKKEAEQYRAYPMRNVSSFRRAFIRLAFATVLVLTVASFTVNMMHLGSRNDQSVRGRVLHDGHELERKPQSFEQLKNFVPNGNRHEEAEWAGWPIKNTKLRMFASLSTVIAIALVMIPWRSATVNHIFGFYFFCMSGVFLACFIFDVSSLNKSDTHDRWMVPEGQSTPFDNTLPNGNFQEWPASVHTEGHEAHRTSGEFTEAEARRGPYIVLAILEFFVFLVLLVYWLLEHLRVPGLWVQCDGCKQDFSVLEIGYHKKYECSKRLVACEYCPLSFKADQFVHEHRFRCPEDSLRCNRCSAFVPEWARADHEKECLQVAVKCGMCDDLFMRYDMPRHVINCKNKPQACPACGEVYKAGELKDHMERCPHVMCPCPQCGAVVRRSHMVHHSQYECPMRSGHYDAAHGL